MCTKTSVIKLVYFLFVSTLLFSCGSSEEEVTPDFTEPFIGSFTMSEFCSGRTDKYSVRLSATDIENEVQINNFYGASITIKAKAVSTTRLIIDEQIITLFGSDAIVQGTASLTSGQLTFEFILKRTGGLDDLKCTSSGNKR